MSIFGSPNYDKQNLESAMQLYKQLEKSIGKKELKNKTSEEIAQRVYVQFGTKGARIGDAAQKVTAAFDHSIDEKFKELNSTIIKAHNSVKDKSLKKKLGKLSEVVGIVGQTEIGKISPTERIKNLCFRIPVTGALNDKLQAYVKRLDLQKLLGCVADLTHEEVAKVRCVLDAPNEQFDAAFREKMKSNKLLFSSHEGVESVLNSTKSPGFAVLHDGDKYTLYVKSKDKVFKTAVTLERLAELVSLGDQALRAAIINQIVIKFCTSAAKLDLVKELQGMDPKDLDYFLMEFENIPEIADKITRARKQIP